MNLLQGICFSTSDASKYEKTKQATKMAVKINN